MIRRPPRSTQSRSSAASDVYKRQALGERRGVESLLELVLLAVLQGEVQQPVRVEGVAGPGKVEAEVEAFLGRRDRHVVDHDLRLGNRASVLAREPLGVRSLFSAARGCGHVELKTAPDQLYLVAVVDARQGGFEAALTDVAPRADNCLLYTSPSPRD